MRFFARHRYCFMGTGFAVGVLAVATVVYAAIITLTLEDMHRAALRWRGRART